MNNARWYYIDDADQLCGPHTWEEIVSRAAGNDFPVIRDGMTTFAQLSTLAEFAPKMEAKIRTARPGER